MNMGLLGEIEEMFEARKPDAPAPEKLPSAPAPADLLIIDTAEPLTAHIAALSAARIGDARIGGVRRYLDPIGPDEAKVITKSELTALLTAGFTVGLVSEGWGDFAHGGISAGAGERDAKYVLAALAALGAPDWLSVAFAVDTDATVVQIRRLVLPYFAAIAGVFAENKRTAGVYGSGAVCSAVLSAKTAAWSWLACASKWSGTADYSAGSEWTLRQHLPSRIAGLDCDVNDLNPASKAAAQKIAFGRADVGAAA
jgi:Domain of unknown function (DUF1906)